MKKNLSIILLTILFVSCNSEIDRNRLRGNYYLFSEDSIYSELYISDKEMVFYNDITDVQFWNYHFNNDTLIIKTKIPNLVIKYLIDISNSEHIILEKSVNNEKIDLKSIKDSAYKLLNAFNKDFNHFKYQIAYSNRRNQILGVSKRFNYDRLVKSEKSDSIPKTTKLIYEQSLHKLDNIVVSNKPLDHSDGFKAVAFLSEISGYSGSGNHNFFGTFGFKKKDLIYWKNWFEENKDSLNYIYLSKDTLVEGF